MKRIFKKFFSLILIIILVVLCYFQRGWFKEQYNHLKGMYYIYKGDKAYSADNMGKTLDYYNLGLQLFPKHYEAWYNLGNIYAVHEDYYSAVDAYEHAIKANPKFVMAKMNLGIIYSEDLGFFDDAIIQFDEITKIKLMKLCIPFVYSNIKSIKGNRGLAYFNKGVAWKQKAMFLPQEKIFLYNEYLGNAIESYTKALKLLKKNYDIYYNRAVAHHLRGEYRDAGLDYCKAIQISPMKFEGHYNLAVLLRQLNRNRDSITELQKAALLISESPNSSSIETTYIFNLLNEVSRRLITSDEYFTEKLSDLTPVYGSYTYIHGKVVADEDFDKAIYANFKTCAGIAYFEDKEEE
ncbi:MAG: tetratricopeptide repeat protein [bacterium]|nr:tetratricopeptide repeat protein [bacterium]